MEDFVLLPTEETLFLIGKAQHGSEEAKEKLVQSNYPLIKSIVARFRNKGVEYDDLYQLGCVGFLKAIKNFDTNFNVKFSTYAVPMIAGEIKRFLRDDGGLKVSRVMKTLFGKINKFVEDFRKIHEKDPTISEIAENFEVDEQEIVFAMEAGKNPISISDKNENQEKGLSLLEKLAIDDGGQERLLSNIALKEAISSLGERDRKIVYLRYFCGKTQSEIAENLKVSQVQISRLENKILENLKGRLKD